ncbi:MAG: TIGR03016 family PEP-CTERM system-associated outer membrane protein [Gammaproteobacteria bacterium]|nr:TIGR03016 family PEP-CTERM system-associated outer membrane protein [Gammaproteobacteria bacterium]
MTPRLSLSETYTNNVSLSADNKQDEYITSLNPGVDIHARGGRARLDLAYNLENLYYARESSRNKTYQQLLGKADAELVRDWFFLEGGASISQTVIDSNQGLTTDNLNITNNRTDVVTTEVTPILRHAIGTVAEAELKYSHRSVYYGGGGASDAVTDEASARLNNGRHATHFFWGMSYNQTRDDREVGADSERKSSAGHLQYRPRRWISLVGYAGREAGTIASQRKFAEGSYWSAGVIWEPTPRWLFEATSGDKEGRGRVEWTPTERTTLKANYLKREVGIYPGEKWDASFNHRTRRSQWVLSHSEEITSDITLASREQILSMASSMSPDDFVNLFNQSSKFVVNGRPFLLTNEEFDRAYTQLKTTINTGKTQFSVSGFHENRKYQLTPRSESANGGVLGVNWKFAPRSSLNLSHSVTMRNNELTGVRETRISDIALHRTISPRASTWLDFRHAKEDAANNTNEYQENRVALHLAVTF